MHPHRGPILTIQHAVGAGRSLWAFCLECGHANLFDPWWLVQRTGNIKLEECGPRMKCQRCGAKGAGLVVPHPRRGMA